MRGSNMPASSLPPAPLMLEAVAASPVLMASQVFANTGATSPPMARTVADAHPWIAPCAIASAPSSGRVLALKITAIFPMSMPTVHSSSGPSRRIRSSSAHSSGVSCCSPACASRRRLSSAIRPS